MLKGTPQGSVLSCTCFLIAINEITDSLPPLVKGTLYVDDFAIYASSSRPQIIVRQHQNAINNLSKWSNKTGFQFSQEKTFHACV